MFWSLVFLGCLRPGVPHKDEPKARGGLCDSVCPKVTTKRGSSERTDIHRTDSDGRREIGFGIDPQKNSMSLQSLPSFFYFIFSLAKKGQFEASDSDGCCQMAFSAEPLRSLAGRGCLVQVVGVGCRGSKTWEALVDQRK